MPLLKRAKAMLVLVVLGFVLTWVACSGSPPVAPVPAGKATCALCDFLGDDRFSNADGQGAGTEAEDDSTLSDAEDDSTSSDAEDDSTPPAVVSFADANLERAVRRTLKKPEGPPEALASLTRLDVERQDVQNIESLAGLEHCTALDTLNLFGSEIADLSPLSG